MADLDQARRFLEALFPDVPDDGAILIWTLRGRRSHWATSVDDCLPFIEEVNDDLYVGACLGPRSILDNPNASRVRAKKNEVVAMPGLWADIDFAHDVHQKENIPPDIEAARALLDMMPVKPTIVLHSGHGLQAWWLFQELFDTAKTKDRERAHKIALGWETVLHRHASAHNWTVDSVADLARVMRIPGTVNAKGDVKVDVKLLELHDSQRYLEDTIEEFLPVDMPEPRRELLDRPTGGNGVSTVIDDVAAEETITFTIDPLAKPPFDKFTAFQQNDPTFAETWEQRRKDMKDQSPSGYDLSLATQTFLAGWTDQEIVNLLIAFRRGINQPKLRRDYLLMTLTKAKQTIARDEASERLEELAAITQAAAESGANLRDSAKFRSEALARLTQQFGFKVIAIEKTESDPPLYFLRTEFGSTLIGRIKSVTNKTAFLNAVGEATGVWLKEKIDPKKVKWDSIVQVILNAAVDVDIGGEATNAGAAGAWITGYLDSAPPLDLDANPDERVRRTYPVIKTVNRERLLLIDGVDLKGWLKTARGWGDRVNSAEYGICLRAVGGEQKSVRLYKGSKPIKRWCFPVNDEWLPDRAAIGVTAAGRVVTACNPGEVTESDESPAPNELN